MVRRSLRRIGWGALGPALVLFGLPAAAATDITGVWMVQKPYYLVS